MNTVKRLLDISHLMLFQFISEELCFDRNMKKSFCHNKIEKKKETTCRVVMRREFDIKGSLTMECSYCSGENKKVSFAAIAFFAALAFFFLCAQTLAITT